MIDYANNALVHRIVHEIIGPVVIAAGYIRPPGTRGFWHREMDGRNLGISVAPSRSGSVDHGGSVLNDSVLLRRPDDLLLRECRFSLCLLEAELNELRHIQAAVNARRPHTDWTRRSMLRTDLPAQVIQDRYREPSADSYAEGAIVDLTYFSEDDVRAFAGFIAKYAVTALDRFNEDRCPPPLPPPPDPGYFKTVVIP